jgi:DNA-directed RNA polymerase subunit omega
MLDELKEEQIIQKVGGRFRLTALMQKRLVALNGGSRPLVNIQPGEDSINVVLREIMEDKIYLDSSDNLKTVEPTDTLDGPAELDLDSI